MKVFVFKSELEAEQFVTEGYPVFAKTLKGEEVQTKGITTRVAEWVKNPDKDEWYVEQTKEVVGRSGQMMDIDYENLFPAPKFFTK